MLALTFSLLGLSAVDSAGQWLRIDAKFDDAGQFHEGMAPARSGLFWGFIDRYGSWIVEPTYQRVKSGSEGRFAVEERSKWGFINTVGDVVVPPAFEDVRPFRDGVAAVKEGGYWRFIGAGGKTEGRWTDNFTELTSRDGGYALAKRGDVWVILPPEGAAIELGPYIDAKGFVDGLGAVKSEAGWYIVDTKGRLVSSSLKDLRPFSGGFAAATDDGELWGYIGRSGRFAIDPEFEAAREFSNGVAPVKARGKWGFVDMGGSWILRPTYDAAYTFKENYALVRQGKKRGFLEFNGNSRPKEWVEPTYDDAFGFAEGLAPVKQGDTWGFLGSNENYVAEEDDIKDIEP